jgi:hypothetical protein
MRMRIALFISLAMSFAPTVSGADFEAEVGDRSVEYQALRADPLALAAALDGRYSEVHDELDALVPDEEKSAADHFVLGNMFYDVDPDRSFAHHRAALEVAPDEPALLLEMAYQHHRRSEFPEALSYYERVVTSGNMQPPQYALLAHCLLKVGRYQDAVKAWKRAGHGSRHTGIDFTIHDVFGELSPLSRHDRLVTRVRAQDRMAIGALLENALSWEGDWWNSRQNWQAFDVARAVIIEVFPSDTKLMLEVDALKASYDAKTPEAFAALLRKEGLILDKGQLPKSSFVARRLITRVAQSGLATGAWLAKRYTAEVDERARGAVLDSDALFLLGAFTAEAGDSEALRAVDEYGWKRYGDADFALSLVLDREASLGEAFSADDPLLKAALDEFPADPRFALTSLLHAVESGTETVEQVARLIDAEYHGLRTDDSRYSYALDGYFAALAERLPKTAAASPAPSEPINAD